MQQGRADPDSALGPASFSRIQATIGNGSANFICSAKTAFESIHPDQQSARWISVR